MTAASTFVPPRTRQRLTERRPPRIAYALLIVAVLASVFPFWWMFVIGSHDGRTISTSAPPLLPGGYFIVNALHAINAVPFWLALFNSVVVAVSVSASVVVFSTLAGYSFSKLTFRGRDGLLIFVIATTAVPTQLSVVPLFIAMSQLGWAGTIWAVILPSLVTPFGVFWMSQYLRSTIPYELIEAARVDGCSMIRTFWTVAVPAARPAAAMLALFTFVTTWTNFFWPFVVLPPSNPTLPVVLQSLQSGYFINYSLVLAGVSLATIPLLLLFVAAGKQLVSGIMEGAVKG